MKQFVSKLLTYIAGVLSGVLVMSLLLVWGLVNVPSWLVVEEDTGKAEIAVILGGGGGSRLSKGLALYEAGLVERLVLVDINKEAWTWMLNRFCPECEDGEKDVVFLEGSTSTFTDAQLVHQYTSSHDIDSILVVTDPYHTRRSSIIFKSRFKRSGVDVAVVNSGDYVGKLTPAEHWWSDNATASVIWGEISRIFVFYLKGYELLA